MNAAPSLLFKGPMIRALMEGAKTETRRLAINARAARLAPGQLVWVRENFRLEDNWDSAPPSALAGTFFSEMPVWHEADCGAPAAKTRSQWDRPFGRLRPAIHMPRWASRLTLEIRGVRREPLQAIDDAGASAEGVRQLWNAPLPGGNEPRYGVECERGSWIAVAPSPREAYAQFWDGLHPAAGLRWADSPDVTVIAFAAHRQNINAMLARRGPMLARRGAA